METAEKHWYQGMEQALASIVALVFRNNHFESSNPEEVCNQAARSAKNLTDMQRVALSKKLQSAVRHTPITITLHGSRFFITNSGDTYTIHISKT